MFSCAVVITIKPGIHIKLIKKASNCSQSIVDWVKKNLLCYQGAPKLAIKLAFSSKSVGNNVHIVITHHNL